jgi:type III pantothenate kinase
MLLTIDAGNTQTVFGLYERESRAAGGAGAGLVDHWRLSTDSQRTHDEYAVLLRNFLDTIGYDMDSEVTGVAICSGVPRVLANLRQMVGRYFEFDPVVIEPGVKTGMPILYDNPKEVGADRIANAVAAFELYGGPTVVVDFGTGTNFDVISEHGEFVGGAISPGIEISLDALFGRAAALRAVELVEPRNVIGKSTVESIQSGAVYGFVALVDGMVERFRKELGHCHVVSTGGLSHLLSTVSVTIEHVEPFLTLHGLRLVHEKNTGR